MNEARINVYVLGSVETNCYFLCNTLTGEALIIDPADNASFIQNECKKLMVNPVALLLTHGHFDHILAADEIRKALNIPIYAGAAERELLSSIDMNLSKIMNCEIELTADQWLNDRDSLDLAGFSIEAISTPGHTAGSVCYYLAQENILFSGDTLFENSFGRTDFPTGDISTIRASIKDRLFTLPDNTIVYPGHDNKTTIAREKRKNMILSY